MNIVVKVYKSACTSTHVVPPNVLYPTPTSSNIKTPKNTQQEPEDPESADGDIETEYFSD